MRQRIPFSLALLAALALVGARSARAEDPDIRAIRPSVMLLVDTSLSMEYRTGFTSPTTSRGCSTPGACPACNNAPTDERNRWTTTLEALTGTFSDFRCARQGDAEGYRTTPMFSGKYDFRAHLPYHQPTGTAQLQDGILDSYIDRVRFGLMTFDGAGTVVPSSTPFLAADITTSQYNLAVARMDGPDGMYSYGRNVPYNFPGCVEYTMNNGARGPSAPEGGLVSVGNESTDFRANNAQIQSRLLAIRPFGGTPIAGMLDDAKEWLQTNPDVADPNVVSGGDPFYQCRSRYLLLLTDGYPDSDKRTGTINCEQAGGRCPYDRAEDLANSLCQLNAATGKCEGASRLVDGIFVVGLSVGDATSIARLNLIAQRGGTGSALLASDRATLLASLASALDRAATGVTTRTAPAFSSGSNAGTQLEFATGFVVGNSTTPWRGVLDRRRYVCNTTTLQPELQPVAAQDRFHDLLEAQTTRTLYTVAPTSATAARTRSYLVGQDLGYAEVGTTASAWNPAETGLTLSLFASTNAALKPAHFGLLPGDDARKNQLIDWVRGAGRPNMGDIYHSTPVVVGPPQQDIADESFNLFRNEPTIATRPTVVYVGTNDGILHAFVAEDFTVPATRTDTTFAGTTLTAGTELWGFVPPAVLPMLDAATSARQPLVDGTPVVKDVFLRRTPGQAASADLYRTVMVVPLRSQGVYFALDISDPFTPRFLWQFTYNETTHQMGLTYGKPGIGQVLVETSAGAVEERAVAVLPGGLGAESAARRADNATGCPSGGTNLAARPPATTNGVSARSVRRCWPSGTYVSAAAPRVGQSLTFLDFATGRVIRRFDETLFEAPVSGGVSLFPGDVGTVATRAYVTDQDGVIWRVDLSNKSTSAWTAQAMYDMFSGGTANSSQPAFEAPIVSTDLDGNPVVIQATGDVDALDSLAANRVASITETATCDGMGCTFANTLNWEAQLAAGEQVTGPLQLFDGKVYFATFTSQATPTNACDYGASRLWGVEYMKSTTVATQTTPYPAPGIESPAGSGSFVSRLPDIPNAIIMGVGVTQRPTCFNGLSETDAYSGGTRYRHSAAGGGEFQLVAQVSGGGPATPALGSVPTITRTLTPPTSLTSIQAWSGGID
jgi:type IV pilus assembly protein PilY1